MDTIMTVGLVQMAATKENFALNLQCHLDMIAKASAFQTDVIVFPELSLTGYELELAAEMAISPEAVNFRELSHAAVSHHVIVVAGCPLRAQEGMKPTIGAVICFPDGRVEFYSKQYLHAGEAELFSAGATDYLLEVKGYRMALAVCADFAEPEHGRRARLSGADIYIVSALISESGFPSDACILSEIAHNNEFTVMLSNHVSMTGGWKTCGKNSVWNSRGEHVFCSSSQDSGLVLCTLASHSIEARFHEDIFVMP